MFVRLAFALSVALVSYAQDATNNTQLGIEAIEAHFNNSGIVPSLLSQFLPTALLTLDYTGVGQVQPGQKLTVDQVKPTPSLTLTPANSSVILTGNFTLAMVDADIVGADETKGQTRHWLVNGVTVSGNKVALDNTVKITDYASPFPAPGSGAHRYVVILYTQPSSFAPTGNLAQPGQKVEAYDLNQYVSSSGLGPIVAATYYTVEQGTASASVSATSAVITSTLPAPKATGSGSTSSSSGAAQPTSSGKNSASMASINAGFFGVAAFVVLIIAA